MSIVIGSARIDENGNTSGGKAGDQKQTSSSNDTKGEVSMQDMYTHSKGWYIIRPKKDSHASKLASAMKTACNNSHIGYDQNQRLGIITYGTSTVTDTECDCSSLVRQCIIEATGTDAGNFTTDTEANMLAKTGLFEDKVAYTSQSKTPVYNGDILVTKTKGHTAIVVSGNSRTASTDTTPKRETLTVDGSIGPNTVTQWQLVMGQTKDDVDGFISGQDSSTKKSWTAISSKACGFTGGASAVAKKWQKYLIGKGYSCGSKGSDGLLGTNTAKATQKFLIAKGYSCGSKGADGYIGTNSAKAFQKWLNDQK